MDDDLQIGLLRLFVGEGLGWRGNGRVHRLLGWGLGGDEGDDGKNGDSDHVFLL